MEGEHGPISRVERWQHVVLGVCPFPCRLHESTSSHSSGGHLRTTTHNLRFEGSPSEPIQLGSLAADTESFEGERRVQSGDALAAWLASGNEELKGSARA